MLSCCSVHHCILITWLLLLLLLLLFGLLTCLDHRITMPEVRPKHPHVDCPQPWQKQPSCIKQCAQKQLTTSAPLGLEHMLQERNSTAAAAGHAVLISF
jgi:hypothetical protein